MSEDKMNLEDNETGKEELLLPPSVIEDKPVTKSKAKPKAKPKAKRVLQPTGKLFVGEEDRRLMKKYNKYIINKLGLFKSRSHKI